MLITDSPHAAGTPEHNEWVRKVFIPTVSHERVAIDRAKYGAEAIGGKFVNGQFEQVFASVSAGVVSLGGAFRTLAQQTQIFQDRYKAGLVTVHLPDWVYQLVDAEEIDRMLAMHGAVAAPRIPPLPQRQANRAERRERRLPPVRAPREWSAGGGRAAMPGTLPAATLLTTLVWVS